MPDDLIVEYIEYNYDTKPSQIVKRKQIARLVWRRDWYVARDVRSPLDKETLERALADVATSRFFDYRCRHTNDDSHVSGHVQVGPGDPGYERAVGRALRSHLKHLGDATHEVVVLPDCRWSQRPPTTPRSR